MKKILFLLIGVFMLFAVAGCGTNNDADDYTNETYAEDANGADEPVATVTPVPAATPEPTPAPTPTPAPDIGPVVFNDAFQVWPANDPIPTEIPIEWWEPFYINGEILFGVSVTRFGVNPSANPGGPDVAAQVQHALNSMVSPFNPNQRFGPNHPHVCSGGGALVFPPGFFRFEDQLLIPFGVTILGHWEQPDILGGFGASGINTTRNTIFEVVHGHDYPMFDGEWGAIGNVNAFISMRFNSGVRGITFWYPNQNVNNITRYPATVRLQSEGTPFGSWGNDANMVMNSTFINSYIGIWNGPYTNAMPNVYNVHGTPLRFGYEADNTVDVGRYDHIYFSPIYWETSGLPGSPRTSAERAVLRYWLRTEAIAINFGQVDWSYFTNTRIEGYFIGVKLRRQLSTSGVLGNFPNGQLNHLSFYDNHIALQIEGTSNAGFIFANMFIDASNDIGIYVPYYPYSVRAIQFNVGIFRLRNEVAGEALRFNAPGRMLMLDSEIYGRVYTHLGSLVFTNTRFYYDGAVILTALDEAASVHFTGSLFNGVPASEARVDNQSEAGIFFEDAYIEKVPVRDDAPIFRRVPKRPPTDYTYVLAVDFSRYVFHSAVIQDALDAMAARGGGVVFLPPGLYRIDAPLVIPSYVELQGAVNTPRMPFNIGTIFNVHFGKHTGGEHPTDWAAARPDAVVTMEANSGMRGITFEYPDQQYLWRDDFRFEAMASYPYTIRTRGENIYIVNVSIRNAYDGLDMATYRSDYHYVEGFFGFMLRNAVRIGAGSTGGQVLNKHLNSAVVRNGYETKFGAWPNSLMFMSNDPAGRLASNRLATWVAANQLTTVLGDVNNQFFFGGFSIFGYIGVLFADENGRGADGWMVGHGIDATTVSFAFENIGNMQLLNSQIVAVYDPYSRYLPGGQIINHDNVAHVVTMPGSVGDVVLVNTTLWGGARNSIVVQGNATVNMFNANLSDVPPDSRTIIDFGEGAGTVHLVNYGIHTGGNSVLNEMAFGERITADMLFSRGRVAHMGIGGVHHYRRWTRPAWMG